MPTETFVLEETMPSLSSLDSLLGLLEEYYNLVSNESAAGKIFSDILYYTKRGEIRRILNEATYNEDEITKVLIYVQNSRSNGVLNDTMREDWAQLELRLSAILKKKQNLEDPLGW